MEFLFMTLLLFGTAFAPGDSDDSSDDTDDTTPETPETPETNLTGTDGDDLLNFEDFIGERLEDTTVDTGAGNDTIDFLDQDDVDAFETGETDTPASSITIGNSTINAGDGNDTIRASLDNSTINAGDGDDTVVVLGAADGDVSGGEGNDFITVAQANSDGISVGGGQGDDVIDATRAENIDIKGGQGNDTISFAGTAPVGTGYTQTVTGNSGDDTINYSGSGISSDFVTPTASGGEGADTFNLIIDEVIDPTTVPQSDISDDGTINLSSLTITDFTSGEDVLVIDADAQSEGFTLTNANLTVDDTPGDDSGSSLALTYESDTEATRIVTIGLADATLTFEDITFTGDQTPTLTQTPAPETTNFEFTDEDDEFISGRDTGTFTGDTLDLGAGDDTLDLLTAVDANQDSTFTAEATTISGGDGADTLLVNIEDVTIQGNTGADTIVARDTFGSTIEGGSGSDTITLSIDDGDSTTVRGGSGNDIITALSFSNGGISGGNGDDTITLSGGNQGGAGYVITATGGSGEDTIVYDGGALVTGALEALTVDGGDDADRFELTLNEGTETISDSFTPTDGTYVFDAVNIGDFETEVDVLVIDGTSADAAFTLDTARLETSETDGTTQTTLILSYESDTELNRDVTVGLGEGPVTWDDITFTGEQIPTLTPITP